MPDEAMRLHRTALVRQMGNAPYRLYQFLGGSEADQLYWVPERELCEVEKVEQWAAAQSAEDSPRNLTPMIWRN